MTACRSLPTYLLFALVVDPLRLRAHRFAAHVRAWLVDLVAPFDDDPWGD